MALVMEAHYVLDQKVSYTFDGSDAYSVSRQLWVLEGALSTMTPIAGTAGGEDYLTILAEIALQAAGLLDHAWASGLMRAGVVKRELIELVRQDLSQIYRYMLANPSYEAKLSAGGVDYFSYDWRELLSRDS